METIRFSTGSLVQLALDHLRAGRVLQARATMRYALEQVPATQTERTDEDD